jgi:hypothetical protein
MVSVWLFDVARIAMVGLLAALLVVERSPRSSETQPVRERMKALRGFAHQAIDIADHMMCFTRFNR